jgi:hypothetical protein
MFEWINTNGPAMAAASAVMMVLGLVALPWVVLRLPTDALIRRNPLDVLGERHLALRITLFVVRNAIAVPLIVLGVIMLVTPGNGIVTIVLALILADFPDKFGIERKLLASRPVVGSLNWIRRKGGREEFLVSAD